jgi:hypothetical protein
MTTVSTAPLARSANHSGQGQLVEAEAFFDDEAAVEAGRQADEEADHGDRGEQRQALQVAAAEPYRAASRRSVPARRRG